MSSRVDLSALAILKPVEFKEIVYRAVSENLKDKVLSTEGNRYYSGRYHHQGETGIWVKTLDRVDFRGQDKIVSAEAIGFVSPKRHRDLSPLRQDRGMMIFGVGQSSDFDRESEGAGKIFKEKNAPQFLNAAGFYDFPMGNLQF